MFCRDKSQTCLHRPVCILLNHLSSVTFTWSNHATPCPGILSVRFVLKWARVSSGIETNVTYSLHRLSGTNLARLNSPRDTSTSVSYTHLRAHETVLDLVCRLLL